MKLFLCISIFMLLGLTANAYRTYSEAVLKTLNANLTVFEFEGREAFLVSPKKPKQGNPWIWRARFPNWQIAMDTALVRKGYHIAYVNTGDLFGSPKAMEVWDHFYTYLTERYNLASKVVLEGVSRGGLFVHNWAKKNPAKVACIYAESPVCDIKSWPYKVNPATWNQLKNVYGFSMDEEAFAYSDNPIDNLQEMADLRIPILHVICMSDEIVPPSENSFVFAKNYISAGGSITLMPMKRVFNQEKMKGHHFYIDNPEKIVLFIEVNTRL